MLTIVSTKPTITLSFPRMLSKVLTGTSLADGGQYSTRTLPSAKEDHVPYCPSNSFINYLSKHPSAMHITCTYALHLVEKDMKSLSTLAKCCNDPDAISLPDIHVFLHLLQLVLELSQQYKTLYEATLISMLNDFWVPSCQSSKSVLLHFCRFF